MLTIKIKIYWTTKNIVEKLKSIQKSINTLLDKFKKFK